MRIIGAVLLLLSLAGSAALLFAAWRVRGLRSRPAAVRDDAVTILKPLHGAEPRLLGNLATFLDQDHAGAVQLVCGVKDRNDGAVAVVEALRRARPDADIALVIDPREHGTNAKIGNLLNMMTAARHLVLILSDSDMAVPRDYLAQVTGALAEPGVGAVTCFYRGRGDAGGWSRLAAMGIGQHFLPSVLIGTALGLARPCMGSTIALTRSTLDAIGGFAAFADLLADDHAIGAAVRARGLAVTLPPLLLAHGCRETRPGDLVRQELRWTRTILGIDPAGYIGSVVLHPLPLAIGGALLAGDGRALIPIALALAARFAVARQVDRMAGERTAPAAWIPARDLIAFALYCATFMVRSVDWRGQGFSITRGGRLAARKDEAR